MNPLPIPQPQDGVNAKAGKSKRNKNQKRHKELATRLAAMHGHVCWYCGVEIHETAPLKPHLDHIIPISANGTNHESNRALTCEVCDRAKLNMPLSDFLKWLYRPNKKSIYAIPQ